MAILGDSTTTTPPAPTTERPPATLRSPTSLRSGGTLLRAALRLALGALLGIAALHWLGVALQILRDPNGGFDFISYYAAALAIRDNPAANIYSLHTLQVAALAHSAPYPGTRYMYPPLLAVLILPLTWLPADVALRAWDLFNLALWLACLALMVRLLRRLLVVARPTTGGALPDGARLFVVAVVAFLALTYDPVAAGIGLGQVNVLICFLALLALELELRGRPGMAGAALAIAALLKVYPLVLLGYYLLRGRWRVVRGAAIAFAALVAGMLPVLGIQGLLETRNFLAAGDTAVVLAHNEALLRAPFWFATLAGGQAGPWAGVAGALLVAVVGLAFAAGIVWSERAPLSTSLRAWRSWLTHVTLATAGNEAAGITGYLWAMATMVLVAPVSWEHSYTWVLPPLLLGFCYVLLTGAESRRHDALLLALLAAGYALTTADFPFGFDQTEQFVLGPSVFGVPLRPTFMVVRPLGALLVWFVMGWLSLRASRSPSGKSSTAEESAPVPTPRRLALTLAGLAGGVIVVRCVIIVLTLALGAAYDPTALLR